MLMQDGASVHVYDPKVKKEDAMTEFKYHNMAVDENRFVFCNSPLEAVDGAHALVVLTEWDEFKVYPYEEFYAKMMKPACVFDGRGILNHKALECARSGTVVCRWHGSIGCSAFGPIIDISSIASGGSYPTSAHTQLRKRFWGFLNIGHSRSHVVACA